MTEFTDLKNRKISLDYPVESLKAASSRRDAAEILLLHTIVWWKMEAQEAEEFRRLRKELLGSQPARAQGAHLYSPNNQILTKI